MTGEPNALLSARWVSRAGSPREERDRGRQGERAQRRARMAEGPSLAALARPRCPASHGRLAHRHTQSWRAQPPAHMPNAGLAWLMGTHSLALARPRMPGFPWKDCMATDRIARQ